MILENKNLDESYLMKETINQRFTRMNEHEESLKSEGFNNIAGVDEVGRGPIAGPAVVAAVILDQPIYGLNDSKKLSKKQIQELALEIKKNAKSYAIKEVSVKSIDKYGIRNAILKGMQQVIRKLEIKPDYVLVDYEKINIRINNKAITKGDANVNAIAAASIIAKDYRDQKMIKFAKKYPGYDLENNVGYGTKKHLIGLEQFGYIEKMHRKTFKPISLMIKEEK